MMRQFGTVEADSCDAERSERDDVMDIDLRPASRPLFSVRRVTVDQLLWLARFVSAVALLAALFWLWPPSFLG